jgi:outer membrane lipoprotein carrier protein
MKLLFNRVLMIIIIIFMTLNVQGAEKVDNQKADKQKESTQKADPKKDEILNQVEKIYNGYKDMKAEFTQESYNSTSDSTKKASGFYYAKKPNLMRWEYVDPEKQYFVIDGSYIWYYAVEDKQVVKNNIGEVKDEVRMLLSFLSSIKNVEKDFAIDVETVKDEVKISMVPKSDMSSLSELDVFLKIKTYELLRTVQYDQFNNKNTIYFDKIEVNTGLKEEQFKFEMPAGVEVIEN